MRKLVGIFCVALLAIGPAYAVVVEGDLAEGLVSAWLFDEGSGDTAIDSAGGNNGIIHGGAKYVAGKFGTALEFNGTDAYVEVPDDPSLHLPEGLTVAAWIYVNKGNNHAAVCWKGVKIGWGPNFSWRVATTADTNMTWGRTTQDTEGWFATDNVITTGTWYHVALTSSATPDGDVYMKAYVNGEDVTGKSGQDGMKTPPPYQVFEGQPVEIGVGRAVGGTVGNDSYFDGIIDEVVIYNRALSAGELRQLADFGAGAVAVEPAGKLATTWGSLKTR